MTYNMASACWNGVLTKTVTHGPKTSGRNREVAALKGYDILYFCGLLMFDISADWTNNAKFCTRKH